MKFKHIGLAFGDGGKINKYLAVWTRLNRQFTLLIIRFRVDTSETHFHKSTLSTRGSQQPDVLESSLERSEVKSDLCNTQQR